MRYCCCIDQICGVPILYGLLKHYPTSPVSPQGFYRPPCNLLGDLLDSNIFVGLQFNHVIFIFRVGMKQWSV